MMRCAHLDEILNEHTYVDLAPQTRAALDRHLADCPRCAAAWRAHEAVAAVPPIQSDPALFARIVGRLDHASREVRPAAPMLRWLPHVGLSALVAVVALAAVVLERSAPGEPVPGDAADTVSVGAADAVTRFSEGRHYRRLPLAARMVTGDGEVEVVEMFMYACFPCFAFEPHLQTWSESRAAAVRLERVPVTWGPLAALHARAFYAAEALGKSEAIHEAFFREVHVSGNPLDTEAALEAFFARLGVDRVTFRRAFESPAVDERVARADALARRFGIGGTPSLIIDGTYVTGGEMAESYETLVEIVDELVTESATCRGREAPASCRF